MRCVKRTQRGHLRHSEPVNGATSPIRSLHRGPENVRTIQGEFPLVRLRRTSPDPPDLVTLVAALLVGAVVQAVGLLPATAATRLTPSNRPIG
jgi:hypothetical protein